MDKRIRGLKKQLGSGVSLKIGKICKEKENQAVVKSKDDMKQKDLGKTHTWLTFFYTFCLTYSSAKTQLLVDLLG